MDKIKQFISRMNMRLVALFVGLYLLSTGVSWAGFSLILGTPGELVSPLALEGRRGKIDSSLPKTENCPLNGAKYTKAEREIWEKRRPLTVMIENHQESRPQSGISRADVIYEAVAEGGITRFLAVFYCGASAEDLIIGPVRSARVYFIDWASEYGDFPLYTHVGGANRPGPADALGQISRLGWLGKGNDLNQFAIGFPTFWRDYERIGHPVATEHTMYASTDKLWELAAKRGLTNEDNEGNSWDKNFVPWKFKEGQTGGKPVSAFEFPFWEGQTDYESRWTWDTELKVWKRENGGQSHTDLNNKEQLQAKTVVVQWVRERALGDLEKHILYTTTGNGDALIFINGSVIQGTWQKTDREDRTKFLDKRGQEIELAPGNIWIEVVPVGTEVSY